MGIMNEMKSVRTELKVYDRISLNYRLSESKSPRKEALKSRYKTFIELTTVLRRQIMSAHYHLLPGGKLFAVVPHPNHPIHPQGYFIRS
jgi:hypothetical protein